MAPRTAPDAADEPSADELDAAAPARGRGGAKAPVTHDVAAETAVVAAILTNPAALDDVVDRLTPEDFHHPGLAATFEAIIACEATGRPIDVVTVADELRRAKQLTKVNGVEGLERLAAKASAVDNVIAHADIVEGHAKLRRIVTTGRGMVAEASAADADPDEVLARAEQSVFSLGERRAGSSMLSMTQAVPQLLDSLTRSRGQLLLGHSTGFVDLDKLTAGLQGGQLWILAARPGLGKSAFGLQIARHVAETSGDTVAVLSYEMGTDELTLRMLSSALRYPASKLRMGEIPDGMDRELAVQAERMAGLQMRIDDNPPSTIEGVRSAMRRLARRTKLGLIVVDYLQLLESSRRKGGNRNDEVSDISRGLKKMASDLDCPVLALSQLSRAVEQRPNKRPILSDLRDSGSVEQDANVVMFLYRENYYDASADPRDAELILAKQRSGQSGVTVHLDWDGPATRFGDAIPGPGRRMGGGGTPSPGLGGRGGRGPTRHSANGGGDAWMPGDEDAF